MILTGTFLLALAIAIPLAILAVQRPGGITDTVTRATSMLGYSLPGYWVGIMLTLIRARLTGFPSKDSATASGVTSTAPSCPA
ncbi:MAG: hypothetical protein R2705_05025 [Ilumatobacteraceae bacterium]